MNALLVHLDEELINQDRHNEVYSPRELAFLIQIYSLFFDRVCVPAPWLVDHPSTTEILRNLRVSEPDAAIRSPDHPFGLLWDEKKFPKKTFGEIVVQTGNDANYVSNRNHEVAKATADLCDEYLTRKITHSPSISLSPHASLDQLIADVFTARNNVAYRDHPARLQRLSACAKRIRDQIKPEQICSRSFYYAIFGLGRGSKTAASLAKEFSHITSECRDLRNHFLTAADYAVMRLIADVPCDELHDNGQNQQIDLLFPPQYTQYVTRPNKDPRLPVTIDVPKHAFSRVLTKGDVINMTWEQLSKLRNSDEYKEFSKWRTKLRQLGLTEEREFELRLNAYIDLVARTLNPKQSLTERSLRLFTARRWATTGYSLIVGLAQVAKAASESHVDFPSESVRFAGEMVTGWAASERISESAREQKDLLPSTFELGNERLHLT